MKKHIVLITLLSCFALPVKAGMVENEIIFMLDASGSLYDPNYANWNAMLDRTSAAMQATIGEENAHGLGIFSGGRSSLSLTEVAQQGNMNMH